MGDSKRFVPITKGCPRSNIMGQKNSGSLDTKQKSQQDKDLKDSFIIFKIKKITFSAFWVLECNTNSIIESLSFCHYIILEMVC